MGWDGGVQAKMRREERTDSARTHYHQAKECGTQQNDSAVLVTTRRPSPTSHLGSDLTRLKRREVEVGRTAGREDRCLHE